MSDLDEVQNEIRQLQDKLGQDLESLQKKDPSQRLLQLNRCQNKLITIRTKIEALDLEILQLDRQEQDPYKASLKELQTRFKDLKKNFDMKKAEKSGNQNLSTEDIMTKNLDELEGKKVEDKLVLYEKGMS